MIRNLEKNHQGLGKCQDVKKKEAKMLTTRESQV
jgi:hypothetical protein